MVATSSRKPKHGIVTVEKAPQSRGTGEQKPGGGEKSGHDAVKTGQRQRKVVGPERRSRGGIPQPTACRGGGKDPETQGHGQTEAETVPGAARENGAYGLGPFRPRAPGGQVHGADPDPGRAQGKGEPRQREDQLQKADAVGADSPGTDRPESPWTQTAGEDWLPSASWPRKTWRFPFSCAHPPYTLWAPAGKNTGRPP